MGSIPFYLRQYLRICLLASFDTLTSNSSNLFSEFRRVLVRAHVDQQVSEDGDLGSMLQNQFCRIRCTYLPTKALAMAIAIILIMIAQF